MQYLGGGYIMMRKKQIALFLIILVLSFIWGLIYWLYIA